ncbi:DNA-binding response regulator [Shewanella sp. Choline-02u-19]|uniref:response regulator transcription factor n=1 Tax=unclassified Shewanella TaxID=196818 RepID=UPI000C33F0BF|nr:MULTISPECIES: response regulator [unclassified Shewanella]PKG59171.1 DNA-binding response regulator [Shewanella sp. GutDb-MelDb]PKG75321.1 DNA-binding response regulator [Shewanella sp. GutCb]PKH57984.1 DNA-binding response regulator [Shewanella sp. Bg11-22]PKI27467.1 DNA-binding response regulator [Shewanella sp. Choline-02u-19]
MNNLYLVDDDQAVLDSLTWMLTGLGYQPKGFLSADSFLQAVDLQQSAIAILDVQMPGMDGSALLNHMTKAGSPITVIMLSGHGNIAMAVQAIQKGALDFLEKPVDGDKLVLLLEQASAQTEQNMLRKATRQALANKLVTLTPREREVMEKVLEGKLNKVIAAELNVAQRTLELHRQKVMQKMQVSNVAELAFLMGKNID